MGVFDKFSTFSTVFHGNVAMINSFLRYCTLQDSLNMLFLPLSSILMTFIFVSSVADLQVNGCRWHSEYGCSYKQVCLLSYLSAWQHYCAGSLYLPGHLMTVPVFRDTIKEIHCTIPSLLFIYLSPSIIHMTVDSSVTNNIL